MQSSSDRVKLRLPCEVSVGARRHAGIVLNVSPGGLFVQTFAKPTSGHPVRVALNVPGHSDAMTLDATVVWKRVVPAGFLRVAQGGVGLSLVNAPEDYYQFLATTVRPPGREPAAAPLGTAGSAQGAAIERSGAGAEEPAAESAGAYRVRVSLGPRSRTLTVRASSEARARETALERAGAGWKVIGSQRCYS